MTAIYILLGIAAFLLFIALLPITVDIKTKEELTVKLKILFVPITLTPKKETPIKLSDWRVKKFRKRRLKEEKKYLEKKLRDEAKARKKAEEKSKAEASGKAEKKSISESVESVLDLIKYVALRAIKKFGRYLRINVYHLRISVGGSEPDKTAVSYGYICQSVSYLTEIFDRHLNVRYPGRTEKRIYVGVDFLSGKTDADVHVSFRIKVWHIISTCVSALVGYLTMPKRHSSDSKLSK